MAIVTRDQYEFNMKYGSYHNDGDVPRWAVWKDVGSGLRQFGCGRIVTGQQKSPPRGLQAVPR